MRLTISANTGCSLALSDFIVWSSESNEKQRGCPLELNCLTEQNDITSVIDMNKGKSTNERLMAKQLAALGSVPRLQLLRVLVKAGDSGLNVGQILSATGMPSSTQFHHLSALVEAGLVERQREGKEIINRVNFSQVRHLSGYLLEDCCKGVP
jgi:ArsR family transcriptional regulator